MEKEYNHIAIDIGNSRIKSAEFIGSKIKSIQNWDSLSDFSGSILGNPRLIVSSVSIGKSEILKLLGKYGPLLFDHQTPLPIRIHYKTPETLGLDRLAAAVGAFMEFKETCLIVDLGSCITYDLVDQRGYFLGGAITPGFKMRMRAMHEFTANLPDIRNDWEQHGQAFPGESTRECLAAGLKWGIKSELRGFQELAHEKFGKINVILTGGDAPFFETILKAPIFVRPNLVMRGLNQILIYNEVKY